METYQNQLPSEGTQEIQIRRILLPVAENNNLGYDHNQRRLLFNNQTSQIETILNS